MRKKYAKLVPVLLGSLLFMLLYSPVDGIQTNENHSVSTSIIENNPVRIDYYIFLSGKYSPIDMDVSNHVIINITLPRNPLALPYNLTLYFLPFSIEVISELPLGASSEYGFFGSPPTGYLTIHVPANASYSSIQLEGQLSGQSFFWRNSASVSVFSYLGFTAIDLRLFLVPPRQSKVLRLYSRAVPDLKYAKEPFGEDEAYVVDQQDFMRLQTTSGLSILYENETWEIYAFIIILATISVILLFFYSTRFKTLLTKVSSVSDAGKIWSKPQKPTAVLKKISHSIMGSIRFAHGKLRNLDSLKLLAAFLACGVLMASISLISGPDPRTKVYVFSSTKKTADEIKKFIVDLGGVAVTSLEEFGDVETLSNLGIFSAAIIADFLPPLQRDVEQKIFYALTNIRSEEYAHSILVLRVENTSWYASDSFMSQIEMRYPGKTRVIESKNSFEIAWGKIEGRKNVFGLIVNLETYIAMSATVGVLSFVLVFIGLAFLANKLVEVGKKPAATGLPEAIVYTIFYFAFTQGIYAVCSVLLAMPLGLHTTRLEAKITAVSLIPPLPIFAPRGFGGGSNPRMLAGIAGFFFGAVLSFKGGAKLDKATVLALLVSLFFIIVDPLTSGLILHEFILLNTVGPSFGAAFQTESYVRDFLANIGIAMGGWASPTYGLSTGIILYFMGAIPLCLFPKLQKVSAALLLSISMIAVGTGGIRVADMNPWKMLASIMPGILVGFLVALGFFLISIAEGKIREKFGQ